MSQDNFIVNGRAVIHRNSGGYAKAPSINFTGEDKKPVSYQVRAESCNLENLSSGLKVNGEPCATIDSYISVCSGDEAGDGGGIFSGTIGGRCDFLTASPDTFVSDENFMVNGKPLVREGDLMLLNHQNSIITQWCQSSGNATAKFEAQQTDEEQEVASPYQILVAILGHTIDSGQQQLALNSELNLEPQKRISCDESGQQSLESDWRWLGFKNLAKDSSYYWQICLLNDKGRSIILPIASDSKTAVEEEDTDCDIQSGANLFIPFRLRHSVWQEEEAFHPEVGSYSDILFFHDELRQKIYCELLHYQLQEEEAVEGLNFKPEKLISRSAGADLSTLKELNKTWYELLSDSLRYQIDEVNQTPSSSAELRSGYVYVFLNGFLWREILINPLGQLLEVDLHDQAGHSTRKAEGLPCYQLYLPCQLAGQSMKIELAYSEIQWSWGRIQYFGGVNPEDIRFRNNPQLWSRAEKADERRQKRFLELDLSVYKQDKPEQGVRKKGRLLHHFLTEEQVAFLYLEDALLPVSRALQDIDFLSSKLHQLFKEIQSSAYFYTGQASYRYFFDNSLSPEKKHLDCKKLEALLKVQLRSRIRQLIEILQEQVILLVCPDESRRKQLPLTQGLDLSPYEIFRDYFSQNAIQYEQAWSMISTLLSRISLNPEQIDNELNIHNSNSGKNSGQEFIRSILKESHPLYPMVFADSQQIRAAQNFDPEKTKAQLNAHEREDNGDFNGLKFASAWHELDRPTIENILNGGLNILHELINSFILSILYGHIEQGDDEYEKAKHYSYQLLQATGQPVLALIDREQELNLQTRGKEFIGYIETSGKGLADIYNFQSKKQIKSANRFHFRTMENGDAVLSVASAEHDIKFNPHQAREALHNHFSQTGESKIYTLTDGFVLKDLENQPLSQDEELRQKQRDAYYRFERVFDTKLGVLKKNAFRIDKATSSILSVFSFINLMSLQRALLIKDEDEHSFYRKWTRVSVYKNADFSMAVLANSIMTSDKLNHVYSGSLVDTISSRNKLNKPLLPKLPQKGHSALALSLLSIFFKQKELLKTYDKQRAIQKGLISGDDLNLLFKWQAKQGQGLPDVALLTEVLRLISTKSAEDGSLTQWAKSSPFTVYQYKENKNDFEYLGELLEILFCPSYKINHPYDSGSTMVKIEIFFPLLPIGKHPFDESYDPASLISEQLRKKDLFIDKISEIDYLIKPGDILEKVIITLCPADKQRDIGQRV